MSMKTFRPFGRSLRAVPCMRCLFLSLSKCILLHQSTSMHLAICCLGVHSTGHILALLSPWHGPMYTTRIWHLGEWVDQNRHFVVQLTWSPNRSLQVCFWALGCLSEQEREAGGRKTSWHTESWMLCQFEVALFVRYAELQFVNCFFCCNSSSH